jgi:hypothetical protein
VLEETETTCPHCWEVIALTLDLSAGDQVYIEDCPVCCHPMRIRVRAEDGELQELEVDRADG